MSDFVRKRIEALTTNAETDTFGDFNVDKFDTPETGSISTVSTTIDSSSQFNRKNYNCENVENIENNSSDSTAENNYPKHKGCPICIACFAGFHPPSCTELVRL